MKKNQTFGEQVKAYRKNKGLTQKQFAELVGIDQPRISRIEKGEDFYVSTFEKISKKLAMDEYSEKDCDQIQKLFTRPTKELKPLEDLYRKENPHPKDKNYLPDTTTFYKWIRIKLLGI